MKKFSLKFFITIIAISLVFSPLSGTVYKSKAADISSPGQAVGKAIGAAAACFLSIELTKLAKQPLDEVKTATDAGATVSKAAVGGVIGAAGVPGEVIVIDAGVHLQNIPISMIGASIAQSAATAGNKQGTNSTLSDSQKCLRDTVVKILGDYIVDQTINWIQGGGKPQFVQNWGSFLQDAVNTGVGEAVKESNAAFLCSPFKLQVKISLYPVTRFRQKVDCTLDKIVGNIDNFMTDFQNGSWIGYGSLWQPNNNYFGQILLTYDEASQKAAAKKEAAQNEAIAGSGFLSIQKCVQRDQAEVSNCLSQCRSTDPTSGAIINTCGEGDPRTFCESQASCSKYEASTPGSAVASMATKSLDWDLTYLSMTQSWIAALTNAVVNRVITKGLSYMTSSNPPSTNVADASINAAAAISPSDAAAARSQLFQNGKNIKTAVINNEQAIYNTKNKTLSILNLINGIYTSCGGVATPAQINDIAIFQSNVSSTMQIINDSYLASNGGFQIDANQFLGLLTRTDLTINDINQKYTDFIAKYQPEISDASSGSGKMDAINEAATTNGTLTDAKNKANPPATPLNPNPVPPDPSVRDINSACGKAYATALITP